MSISYAYRCCTIVKSSIQYGSIVNSFLMRYLIMCESLGFEYDVMGIRLLIEDLEFLCLFVYEGMALITCSIKSEFTEIEENCCHAFIEILLQMH